MWGLNTHKGITWGTLHNQDSSADKIDCSDQSFNMKRQKKGHISELLKYDSADYDFNFFIIIITVKCLAELN